MRWPAGVVIALSLAALLPAAGKPAATHADELCAPLRSTADEHRIASVLASGTDVWGNTLLAAKNGPTYAAASRFLPPLLYAAGHGGRPLTSSGVYYLPFTLPQSVGGDRGFGLHVADGSQIIVRRVDGPALEVRVGAGGSERFGSCLTRLQTPSLAGGYLPVLEVTYRDRLGVRYTEESFVGRLAAERSLVSFVRISADARQAVGRATIRLVAPRGTVDRAVAPGTVAEVDAAFVHDGARIEAVDADAYSSARAAVVAYWQRGLAPAATFVVPEARVTNAERALLIQELELTWRYSVGNVYEELSFAEALDVAQVMAAYGYPDVSRQILRFTLRRLPERFTYWRAGERLLAGARYFELTRDAEYVAEETPGLRPIVDRLAHELAASRTGLLPRERYSSDIPDLVYSLQGQTLVWEGLLAMSRTWAATGRLDMAAQSRALARRLGEGLRAAVLRSERRLPDGSLFVPAALLDGGTPFARLTASVDGTYWNLVAPYALASGFFPAHGPEARGLLQYLLQHGSRLLGLVRAGIYKLAGDAAASGTDQVYGINVSRFLADNDQPDQLVLSLYGTLAAGLTRDTYVAGEAASVSSLGGWYYRSMYLPPNNDTAATLLETLRLQLLHEVRGPDGDSRGLELAFATPRAWLEDGKSIEVRNAPTTFGAVAYSIERKRDVIRVRVTLPASRELRSARLRLRLPAGQAIARVVAAGRHVRFDRGSGTIDLPSTSRPLELVAYVAGA